MKRCSHFYETIDWFVNKMPGSNSWGQMLPIQWWGKGIENGPWYGSPHILEFYILAQEVLDE